MANTRIVVDMAALAAPGGPTQAPSGTSTTTTAPSKNDRLFGPNIGVLGTGPEWTERPDKSDDVLTPEIVKGWIAKSKEVSVCYQFVCKDRSVLHNFPSCSSAEKSASGY